MTGGEEEPATGSGLMMVVAAGAALLCAGNLTGEQTVTSLGVVISIASGLAAIIHLRR